MTRCNMSMGAQRSTSGCGSQNSLLLKLQQIDCSIYDVVLYLDAYPDCAEALAYYHSLLDTRAVIAAEYEHKYGPLTAFSNTNKCSWDWSRTPWPGQM